MYIPKHRHKIIKILNIVSLNVSITDTFVGLVECSTSGVKVVT